MVKGTHDRGYRRKALRVTNGEGYHTEKVCNTERGYTRKDLERECMDLDALPIEAWLGEDLKDLPGEAGVNVYVY